MVLGFYTLFLFHLCGYKKAFSPLDFPRFSLEMGKGTRGRRGIASRQCRPTPYPLQSCNQDVSEGMIMKCSKNLEKKDWEDATCSVCMEYPHNAVLLLCSSYDMGCRPYMCGTSFRYSNCLDQYKKAYTKLASMQHDQPSYGFSDNSSAGSISSWPVEKCEIPELACPLCRGQVKGWTVVEPAREYLNAKKRSCMQDNCSFAGTYKELRKHVRAEHPCAQPREVDPALEQKWRSLEHEREREDVLSTIRSSMPGAMISGDYVIEGSHYGLDSDEEVGFDADVLQRHEGLGLDRIDSDLVNVFLLLQAFGPAGNVGQDGGRRQQGTDLGRAIDGGAVGFRHNSPVGGFDLSDEDSDSRGGGNGGVSLVHRLRRQGRFLLGRSGRRRRRREASGSQR